MIRTPMPKVKSKEYTKSKIRDPLTIYFIAIGPSVFPRAANSTNWYDDPWNKILKGKKLSKHDMSVAKWIELSGELPTKTVPYVDG